MAEVPFYDYRGEILLLPPPPSAIDDDAVPATGLQSFVTNISRALGKIPTSSCIRAASENLTLEVGFEGGVSVIARKILPTDDLTTDNWRVKKLRIEARLLAWFERSSASKLPIPRLLSPLVHSSIDEPDPDRSFFFITQKLPGTGLLSQYGLLDTKAKERTVQSYAHFCLEMFRLKVPQKDLGSFVPGTSPTANDGVGPIITVQSRLPTKPFADIREYFDFLLEMKKRSHSIGGDDGGHLDELRVHINALLDDLTSRESAYPLLRCVLAHEDLNEMNILIDKHGRITGVIDWEYQSIKPAILVAEYPPWLCYDGCSDPRFADPTYILWVESPEESKRLCDLYLQVRNLDYLTGFWHPSEICFARIVKDRDEEYWEALVQGAKLRSCVRWLNHTHTVDEGCRRMKQWMDSVFS